MPVTDIIADLDGEGGLPHLLATVPALAIHLEREVQGFTSCVSTLLDRVEQDRSAIGARFFGTHQPDKLQDITLTNSDPHKQGNRVAILSFGDDRQVVYKPRDVRIDEALSGNRLAPDASGSRRSLLEAAGAPDMTYTFLPVARDGVDYGYVQFLPHTSAQDHVIDAAQAQKAFGDLGRAIGALMLAGATDLHHENLMVSGGRFYFTDLEFALSSQATTQMSALLQPPGSAVEQDLSPKQSYDYLMRSMMLDHTFHKATDNNPLCPPYTLDGGIIRPVSPYNEVIESLVILRGVDRDGQPAYLNNRTRPQEGSNIYALYRKAFGNGVTAGLTDIQRSNALAEFHTSIAPFHLRYHPIGTQEHRVVLQALRLDAFHQSDAAAVQDRYNGTVPSTFLEGKLTQILPGTEREAVRDAFRTRTYQPTRNTTSPISAGRQRERPCIRTAWPMPPFNGTTVKRPTSTPMRRPSRSPCKACWPAQRPAG
ncbi:hypothetical protein DDE05_19315 [Streptomyces cavourensis]|nr:hypothetical protein DDE05_19315 [Streptomyces cavourensis]